MTSIVDGASEGDLKRMAILWLYSDMSATNWEAAHNAYDPEKKTQLASFKTVSNRSLAKYKRAVLEGNSANGKSSSQTGAEKPAKAAGKKRKSAAEATEEHEDGGEEAPIKKPKVTRKPRAKKGVKEPAAEKATAEEDKELVKGEAEDDN